MKHFFSAAEHAMHGNTPPAAENGPSADQAPDVFPATLEPALHEKPLENEPLGPLPDLPPRFID